MWRHPPQNNSFLSLTYRQIYLFIKKKREFVTKNFCIFRKVFCQEKITDFPTGQKTIVWNIPKKSLVFDRIIGIFQYEQSDSLGFKEYSIISRQKTIFFFPPRAHNFKAPSMDFLFQKRVFCFENMVFDSRQRFYLILSTLRIKSLKLCLEIECASI